MSLKERIQEDFKIALKKNKETELETLRLLLAGILNKEKEKRYRISKEKPKLTEQGLEKESRLGEEEIIEVISSEIKKRKEALVLFEKGKREDLIKKEKKEIEILQNYLPEQFSEREVKNLAQEIIKKIGAKEIKDMGKVMTELMSRVKGKADGATVSKIVKELLKKI